MGPITASCIKKIILIAAKDRPEVLPRSEEKTLTNKKLRVTAGRPDMRMSKGLLNQPVILKTIA